MGKVWMPGGGGSADLDVVTAGAGDVRRGKVTVDKDGEPVSGTMPENPSPAAALNCGQSKAIPAGYNPGGTVTANSLASQTGGATATDAYVRSGYTYWKDGVKRTGTMTVSSVVSFSVAAYSTSQVLCTWKNPAKGPYSGFAICAKMGGYPNNEWDGRVYTGGGTNSALNANNSALVNGLGAGSTYYFRIWTYINTSLGAFLSSYLQASGMTTRNGRQAFTASGTFTVPANVRSIDIHCTGGGGSGGGGVKGWTISSASSSGGGGGGRTSYIKGRSVSPGDVIVFTVGAGNTNCAGPGGTGGASSALLNGTTVVSALGGEGPRKQSPNSSSDLRLYGGHGGSGGGKGGHDDDENIYKSYSGGDGGSNGSNGWIGTRDNSSGGGNTDGNQAGSGQGHSTREFGESGGTLYSGGGGGGAPLHKRTSFQGAGGAGGGGFGACESFPSKGHLDATDGTGGGGGGGYTRCRGGKGGSGNVIIRW